MAGKKENIKALFTNTRSRVIIIFTFALLACAIIYGIFKFTSLGDSEKTLGGSGVSSTPVIQSIPGAIDPTIQYAKLQETQNVTQAKSALNTGGSAIPTIVRSQNIGDGTVPIGVAVGEAGVGFTTLSMQDQAGDQRSNWLLALQNNSCSKKSVDDVVAQGAKLEDLKEGCSCIQLKDVGYPLKDLEKICSCKELRAAGVNARQLKNMGYTARRLRECGFDACELRNAGFTAKEMIDGGFSVGELKGAGYSEDEINKANGVMDDASIKAAGCDPVKLKYLFARGVTAKKIHDLNGCSAAQLKAAGYEAKSLLDAGFSKEDLAAAGFTPEQIAAAASSDDEIRAAGCDPTKLKVLFTAGVSAQRIRDLNGCSAEQLKAAGYDAKALSEAGYTPAELLAAGFTAEQLKEAGIPDADVVATARKGDCSVASLKAARASGTSATTIRKTLGCSAAAMKAAGFTAAELKAAGYTAAELKAAGFTAAELKAAGYTPAELKAAGFTAAELKAAGYTAAELKGAGFTAAELKAAGYSAAELKAAGFTAAELKAAGFTAPELVAGGFTAAELSTAGFTDAEIKAAQQAAGTITPVIPESEIANLTPPALPSISSTVPPLPSIMPKKTDVDKRDAETAQQLQQIVERQNRQMADQKYQQKIQQRTSMMMGMANQSLQNWKRVNAQAYMAGTADKENANDKDPLTSTMLSSKTAVMRQQTTTTTTNETASRALIKTGDILFAVVDTSVNSDEPGPILATVISGKLKGAKLIGSFNLPANAEKMIISFNTMSVPGASHSTGISAVAIDANTARTALSSKTDTHFLYRYGNLFASSFLSGLGDAFQSADTTVTVGSTGAGDSITVQNGIGRSLLQNTVIALGDVGQAWSQVAQQNFSIPTTVEVYSGTGIGVLFTQDLTSL